MKKRTRLFFLLMILFCNCEKESKMDQIMNYIDMSYENRNYVSFFYPLNVEADFYPNYYTYLFIFWELCLSVLSEKNDVKDLEDMVKVYKENIVKDYINRRGIEYESELSKAKQSEVYVMLKQYFQQQEEQLNTNGFDYYMNKIDLILFYLDQNAF